MHCICDISNVASVNKIKRPSQAHDNTQFLKSSSLRLVTLPSPTNWEEACSPGGTARVGNAQSFPASATQLRTVRAAWCATESLPSLLSSPVLPQPPISPLVHSGDGELFAHWSLNIGHMPLNHLVHICCSHNSALDNLGAQSVLAEVKWMADKHLEHWLNSFICITATLKCLMRLEMYF